MSPYYTQIKSRGISIKMKGWYRPVTVNSMCDGWLCLTTVDYNARAYANVKIYRDLILAR